MNVVVGSNSIEAFKEELIALMAHIGLAADIVVMEGSAETMMGGVGMAIRLKQIDDPEPFESLVPVEAPEPRPFRDNYLYRFQCLKECYKPPFQEKRLSYQAKQRMLPRHLKGKRGRR